MASKAVNVSSAASNVLIAAVAGKRVRVLGMQLIAAADVTLTFEDSDGTDLWGPVSVSANGGFAPPVCPDLIDVRTPCGYFETEVGKGLNILLGSAVQVGGGVQYVQR